MDDERFAHMLVLSDIYLPVLQERAIFDNADTSCAGDRRNTLNALQIIADTFVEMRRRLVLANCIEKEGK